MGTSLTPLQRQAKADQLQYIFPKQLIEEELDRRKVERQTEIWIYPLYPIGFRAVVGAHDHFVYIFEVDRGQIISLKQKPCLGVRPNGTLIYEVS